LSLSSVGPDTVWDLEGMAVAVLLFKWEGMAVAVLLFKVEGTEAPLAMVALALGDEAGSLRAGLL